MNGMTDLFQDLIKDTYNAEKQLLKAMPKMAKAARHPKLKQSIENHIKETEEQVKRLEEVARIGGFKPTGMVCAAMQGLVEEANEHLQEHKPGPVLDALLISGAQKNEHYEICAYGTARAWAKELGMTEIVRLLEQTLAEEVKADSLLNQLAESEVNRLACQAPSEEEESKSKAKSNGKAASGSTKSTTAKASASKASASKASAK